MSPQYDNTIIWYYALTQSSVGSSYNTNRGKTVHGKWLKFCYKSSDVIFKQNLLIRHRHFLRERLKKKIEKKTNKC